MNDGHERQCIDSHAARISKCETITPKHTTANHPASALVSHEIIAIKKNSFEYFLRFIEREKKFLNFRPDKTNKRAELRKTMFAELKTYCEKITWISMDDILKKKIYTKRTTYERHTINALFRTSEWRMPQPIIASANRIDFSAMLLFFHSLRRRIMFANKNYENSLVTSFEWKSNTKFQSNFFSSFLSIENY